MRAVVLAALAASAACVPAGRRPVELPVVLYAPDPGPLTIDGVEVVLDRATVTTADLLLRDADDVLTGAWAGQRAANLLGLPGPHGTVLFYEGDSTRAEFALDGEPTLSISGLAAGNRPFSIEVDGRFDVAPVIAALTIDADEPPARIDWTLDLSIALSTVDWAQGDLDDGADADSLLAQGFSDPTAWRLQAVD